MRIIALTWLCLGLQLAFKKARMGSRVDWIGANISIHKGKLEATIQEEKKKRISAGAGISIGRELHYGQTAEKVDRPIEPLWLAPVRLPPFLWGALGRLS